MKNDATKILATQVIVLAVVSLFCFSFIDPWVEQGVANQPLGHLFLGLMVLAALVFVQVVFAVLVRLGFRVWRYGVPGGSGGA